MVTSWPRSFTAGVVTQSYWHGGGVLSVAPGSIICTPGRALASLSSARPVVHEGTRVEMYIARLAPPWMSVGIPIQGEGAILVATTPILVRGRLRNAFEEAGFEVAEHHTWIYKGYRRKKMRQGARHFDSLRRPR